MGKQHAPEPGPLDEVLLRQILASHDIDVTEWGRNATKPVRSLLHEILQGETTLHVKGPELLREVHIAEVNVFRTLPDGRVQRLIETKQVFKNGSERVRTGPGTDRYSVAEKMTAGEDPYAAAVRALEEELSIGDVPPLKEEGVLSKALPSASYPGLRSSNVLHRYSVILPLDQTREGYEEVQNDKTTYFNWSE